MSWQIQRMCRDHDDYELIVEKQKTGWQCTQNIDAWKWNVSYRGAVVAQGLAADQEQAKALAEGNIPK